MRLLDLFCGRWGWSRAFAQRGWECVGVDLAVPPEIPRGCEFLKVDVLSVTAEWICSGEFDFICASPPCQQFSVFGMKFLKKKVHPFPELGIRLFEHTSKVCSESGVPHVIENVRCAQDFVGPAVNHANAFYLWGDSIPPLLPQGLMKMGNQGGYYKRGTFIHDPPGRRQPSHRSATIPLELANCVADYAERIIESKSLRMEAIEEASHNEQDQNEK